MQSQVARTVAKSAALDVGSIVDRRYRLKREIARGGAGAVFEAEHLYTSRTVAIKLLIAEHADASESHRRLLLEARALTVARHPGIVQGLDAGETEDGTPYLVMELLEGRTLEGILAVRRRVGVADAIYIGMQLCDALATAHEHGIFQHDNKLTQRGAVLGTPEYMAPEQLLASDQVDGRCDTYALGITLYEALAGVVPFEGNFGEVLLKVSTETMPSLIKRCPEVPAELEQAIQKALARDPEDRYPTARAFAEALSQVPRGEAQPTSLLGIRAPVPSSVPRSAPRGAVLPAPANVPPRPAGAGMPSIAGGGLPPPLPAQPAT